MREALSFSELTTVGLYVAWRAPCHWWMWWTTHVEHEFAQLYTVVRRSLGSQIITRQHQTATNAIRADWKGCCCVGGQSKQSGGGEGNLEPSALSVGAKRKRIPASMQPGKRDRTLTLGYRACQRQNRRLAQRVYTRLTRGAH